jgi:hypothetical protein
VKSARGLTHIVVRPIIVVLPSLLVASCGGIGISQFLAFEAPVVALTHVRVIDGSGRPAREDQTVIIESDRIAAVGAAGLLVDTEFFSGKQPDQCPGQS